VLLIEIDAMDNWIRIVVVMLVALASLNAISDRPRQQGGVDDTEIRIGNLMPYTGKLKEFGAIGRAEAAYFRMINERGGINGRQVRFISYDDKSDPQSALALTRRLVEQDDVMLMFGSFGTPGNFAVREYLNEKRIPQIFIASGDDHLTDPSSFPWTIGWQPSPREEGRIYANYIQANYSGKKIVALWQNDQVGREIFRGMEDGLGEVARMIRVDIAYDTSDEHLDTHVSILKQSGAEIFLFAGMPADAARVIRTAANLHWYPVFIVNQTASSISAALKPAGIENAVGVITAAFLKDATDPAWEGEPWQAFLHKIMREGEDDVLAAFGYAAAETLVRVLNTSGNDLSREAVIKAATGLGSYQGAALLPGIKIGLGSSNFRPIKQLRLVQFDGRTWRPIGDVLETAFSRTDN
jgi:ABC-type branched-subunit amino acid transport system substrate-binding protein